MIHPQIFLNWQIVTKENTMKMIKKLKYYLNKTTNIDCFFDKIIVRHSFTLKTIESFQKDLEF
jgi:Holliday junction resolvase-like predicted endonuclease